jgi:ribosomal protein S25
MENDLNKELINKIIYEQKNAAQISAAFLMRKYTLNFEFARKVLTEIRKLHDLIDE